MSEQIEAKLYKIETRKPENGDMAVIRWGLTDGYIGVLESATPPPAPQPGTLEWAREHVASGGEVWRGDAPLERLDASDLLLPDGSSVSEQILARTDWHPWGDRAWLAALPDGTRVVAPNSLKWVKGEGSTLLRDQFVVDIGSLIQESGWDLVREPVHGREWLRSLKNGTRLKHPTVETIRPCMKWGNYIESTDMDGEFYRWPIDQCQDSGWELVKRYEPDAERMKALAQEYLGDGDESRIETLESHVEQHDHLMADLAARLAKMERGG